LGGYFFPVGVGLHKNIKKHIKNLFIRIFVTFLRVKKKFHHPKYLAPSLLSYVRLAYKCNLSFQTRNFFLSKCWAFIFEHKYCTLSQNIFLQIMGSFIMLANNNLAFFNNNYISIRNSKILSYMINLKENYDFLIN